MMRLQHTKLSILLASLLASGVSFRTCNAFSNEGTIDEIGATGNIRSSRQLQTVGTLKLVGNNGLPSSVFPLGRCQGDCDSNAECAGNLVCFQRDAGQAVPGCSGTLIESNDYCVRPVDIDGPPAPAPTPSGTALNIVGDNGSPSSKFPLGRCQGDCDSNAECAGDLVCFQRDAGQAVPGCSGTPVESKDYCVRTGDLPPPTPKSGTFRLKMYHEPGYWWQCDNVCDQSDITKDKDPMWCIQCDGDACDDAELIKIRTCSSDNSKFEFVATSELGKVKIRVVGTNLCLMYESYASTLRNTRLNPCGGSGEIWSTHGQGSFSGSKFELHPQGDATYCLTQQHHPKSGEDLRLEKCSVARADNTNWWMTY